VEVRDDRRSRLRLAFGQLDRAELYVVAARELAGTDTEAGRAVEELRQQLLAVADGLRQERRTIPLPPRGMSVIGE
jgi:hypothetical protein